MWRKLHYLFSYHRNPVSCTRNLTKSVSWCEKKNVSTITEKVALAYFSEVSCMYKTSTLWSTYSMLWTTIYLNKNVDISKFTNVIAFLKRKSDGYKPKESTVFSKQEVEKFMKEASDERCLLIKVVLIAGIFGACRRVELTNLHLDDIDVSSFIKISISTSRNYILQRLNITDFSFRTGNLHVVWN